MTYLQFVNAKKMCARICWGCAKEPEFSCRNSLFSALFDSWRSRSKLFIPGHGPRWFSVRSDDFCFVNFWTYTGCFTTYAVEYNKPICRKKSNKSPTKNKIKNKVYNRPWTPFYKRCSKCSTLTWTQAWVCRIQFPRTSSNVPPSYSLRRRTLLAVIVIHSLKSSRFITSVRKKKSREFRSGDRGD